MCCRGHATDINVHPGYETTDTKEKQEYVIYSCGSDVKRLLLNQFLRRGGRPPSRRPRVSARRACSSDGVRISRLPIASSQVGMS